MKFGVKELINRVARVLAVVFIAGLFLGGNTTAEAAISLDVNQVQVNVDYDQKDQVNYKMVIKKETDSGWASKTWDTYRTTMSWDDVLRSSNIKYGDEVIMKIEANGGEKLETIRFRIGDTYRFGTSAGGNASSIAWNKSNSTSTGVEQKRTQKGQTESSDSQSQKISSTTKKNKVQQNIWHKENYWTYHRPDGTIITGWAQDQGHWYYLDPQYNGQMCYNCWKNINGSWYYFWGSGAMASNTYVGNYHVNADGVWDYTR